MSTEGLDKYERARLRAMLVGYVATWDLESAEVLAVEHTFTMPLVDDLGCEHPTWKVTGTIDLVLRRPNGSIIIIDHKSAASGASYAKRAVLNGQVGTYFDACDSLGWHADEFAFDVLVRPHCEPRLATPITDRKYTKATKTEPGRLHANQREEDETVDEFSARCAESIAKDPAKHYPRFVVRRSEAEQTSFRESMWMDAELIDVVNRRKLYSTNSDACHRYGAPCDFWQSCAGLAGIDDDTLYVPNKYASGPKFDGHSLSNSMRSSFNACRRQYHYRYNLLLAARQQAKALTFGTAMHAEIEAYWKARAPKPAAMENQ